MIMVDMEKNVPQLKTILIDDNLELVFRKYLSCEGTKIGVFDYDEWQEYCNQRRKEGLSI